MDEWLEWQETIAVLSEGQHPESVIEKSPALTLVDEAGKAFDYDWNPKPPKPEFKGKFIQEVHYTGRYHPFAIQRFSGGDVYSHERNWYSVFPSWNHWPTAQADSSGRNATFPDRAAHCSLTHLFWPLSDEQPGDASYLEKTLMEGMTDHGAVSLVSLAKSWLEAPALDTISDCCGLGYDAAQRAYVLCATGASPTFRIAASAQHPIVNLCFVVKNWNCGDTARLQIDSKTEPAGPAFRQGIVRDPNGRLASWSGCNGKERSRSPSRCAGPSRISWRAHRRR
jgi:hypothetical protein